MQSFIIRVFIVTLLYHFWVEKKPRPQEKCSEYKVKKIKLCCQL